MGRVRILTKSELVKKGARVLVYIIDCHPSSAHGSIACPGTFSVTLETSSISMGERVPFITPVLFCL
jgi:hypothetical protein